MSHEIFEGQLLVWFFLVFLSHVYFQKIFVPAIEKKPGDLGDIF